MARDIGAFVNKAFQEADTDNSGALSRDELLSWIRNSPETMRALGSTEDALHAAFLIFGKHISSNHRPGLQKQMLHHVDKDGNGTLDREEFEDLLRKTHGLDRLDTNDIRQKAISIADQIFNQVSESVIWRNSLSIADQSFI